MLGWRATRDADEDRDLGFGAVVASSSAERLLNRDGSFNSRRVGLVLKGIDETFSQTVHARSSYKAHEIVWSAKFSDIYLREGPQITGIDLGRLDEINRVTA